MRRIFFLLFALCLVAIPLGTLQAQDQQVAACEVIHVVQRGENLFRISLRYQVSMQVIQQLNGIPNVNLIYVGQRLRIPLSTPGCVVPTPVPATPGPSTPVPTQPPTGQTYTVQPGDYLAAIARRLGTTVAAIVQLNGIANPNLIFPGQVLRIPAGGVVPPPGPGTPLPPVSGGFELGGQVQDLNANTQAVIRSARMNWVKFQVQSGDSGANALMQAAKAAGFKVLFSVIGDKARVLEASFQTEYAIYVAGLARSGADAIEVWNEQNLDREWPNGQINPASYVALLSRAYQAIKGANPATLVISGAPAPTGAEGAFGLAAVWNDDRYYQGMAAAGAGQYADCIGVHYNEGIISPRQTSGDPRDNYATRYYQTMLNRALAAFPGKSACFTELGYVSPEGYGPLPPNFSWGANTTAQQQAQWLGEVVSLARTSGRVRLLVVFNIDFTTYTANDPQAGYAIIRPGNVCISCATIAAAMQ